MKVTMEQSKDFINSQKTKGLAGNLADMEEVVIAHVEDDKTKEQVLGTIKDQKAKMAAAYNELVRRGRESDAYKFVEKCLNNLKDMLHRLVGHIKDLWAKLVAVFKKQEVLMLAA